MQSEIRVENFDEFFLVRPIGKTPAVLASKHDPVACVVDVVESTSTFHSVADVFCVFEFRNRTAFPAGVGRPPFFEALTMVRFQQFLFLLGVALSLEYVRRFLAQLCDALFYHIQIPPTIAMKSASAIVAKKTANPRSDTAK